jgi:hypothetical protein
MSESKTKPKWATIRDWVGMTGVSRSSTYLALGRGDLRAKKFGSRTLIDVPHGLAWLESMPDANIRTGQRGPGLAEPKAPHFRRRR